MSPRKPASKGSTRAGATGRGAGGAGHSASGGRSAAEQHRAWLELVDTEGPFLSVPVLTGLYPQGMPGLSREHREVLRAAKSAFDRAWDAWDAQRDSAAALASYRRTRDSWVSTVLTEVLGWGDSWTEACARPSLTEAYRAVSDGVHPVTVTPTGRSYMGSMSAPWYRSPIRSTLCETWRTTDGPRAPSTGWPPCFAPLDRTARSAW